MLTRVSDPEGAGICGWIAEPAGQCDGRHLLCGRRGRARGPNAVYRATVLGGRVVVARDLPRRRPAGADPDAGADGRRPRRHRRRSIRAPAPISRSTFSSFRRPRPRAGRRLPGQRRRPSEAPSARAAISARPIAPDGTVAETRGFTNSCLDVEVPAATAGQPARPIGVTHFLDPTPTEIHMLPRPAPAGRCSSPPAIRQRIWLVAGDRIAEVRDTRHSAPAAPAAAGCNPARRFAALKPALWLAGRADRRERQLIEAHL